MNKQAHKHLMDISEFMACTQALVKLNSDDKKTLCRIRQLFAIPTEKVGMKLINAQKHDYDINVKMTRVKK